MTEMTKSQSKGEFYLKILKDSLDDYRRNMQLKLTRRI